MYLSTYLCLPYLFTITCFSAYHFTFISLPIFFICLPYLPISLSIYLSTSLSIFLPVFLFYFISEFYTHPLPFFMSLIFVVKKQLTSDQLMAERDRIIEMNFCPLRNTHTHTHIYTHTPQTNREREMWHIPEMPEFVARNMQFHFLKA